MKDPLAGKRDAINEGQLHVLTWPDTGQGCPVEVGDVFKLRTCHVEITRTQRKRSGREWTWVANYTRYTTSRVWWLDRRGGVTDDPSSAMGTQDDPDAPTIAPGDPNLAAREPPEARRVPHPFSGDPPEETEPPHEVSSLPSSVAAQANYAELHQENLERRLRRSLIEEIRESRLSPAEVEDLRKALSAVKSAHRQIAA